MPIDVQGDNGLYFDASIDDSAFEKGIISLQQKLQKTYDDQKRAQDIATQQQKEYANIILSTGSAFKSLDSSVQAQLKSLAVLNTEYRQVADARKTLDQRFADGVIGVDTYNSSLAALMNKERELSTAIQTVTTSLAQNDRLMTAANGSITQKMAMLEKLKQQYNSLSEVDRNNASVSNPILGQIQSIDAELRTIQNSFNAVEQHALGSINERTQALARLKNEYAALSEIDRNSSAGQSMLANIHAVESEVNKLNSSFTAIQQNAAGSINEKIAALSKLRAEYAALSETDRKNSSIGGAMLNNIKQLDNEVRKLNTDFSQTSNIANKVAVAIGSYLSLNAATDFIKQIVTVRGEFEQLNVAFKVMLGNKDAADKLMAQAVDLAATTPFKLTEVAAGAKQLLAYGTAADDITSTLKTLGNVASGVGAPLNDLVYLYGTLQTQGRAYTRDIMQFTSRGIPIIGELAKQFGVTTSEVQTLVEAGRVGFPEIQKAFQSMTGEGGKFFNLMQEQSKTVTGQISNLGDAFDQMLNEIGQSNEGIITGAIAGLKTLVENYQTVIDIVGVLVATYGAYKAAVMAQSAITAVYSAETRGLAIAETLYATATTIAQRATALLNTTMLANPYVAVATLLVGLAAAIYAMSDSTTVLERATKSLREEEQKATEQKEGLRQKSQELLNIINSETSTRYAQLEAFKELQHLYPGYLNSLDLQKFKTIDAKDAQLEFNKAIDAADLNNLIKQYEDAQATIAKYKDAPKFAALGYGENEIKLLEEATAKSELLRKKIDEVRQAQVEANASPAELAIHYQKALDALKKQRDQLEQSLTLSQKTGQAFLDWKDTIAGITLGNLNKQIDELSKKLAGVNAAPKTNRQLIDAASSLDTLNSIRTKILEDYNKEADAIRRAQLAKDLKYADQRKKILDIYGAENRAAKEHVSIESKINSILDQRRTLLDRIASLQRDAKQSGMLQSDSEVDKVREKYDEAFKAIEDYNKKIADFNKKNKTQLKGIGLEDIDKLTNAKTVEVANTQYKQDAANYIAALDDKKSAFEELHRVQLQGNADLTAQAEKAYKDQLGGFTSYIDFLKNEAAKVQVKITFGTPNIGDFEKLKKLNAEIAETQRGIDKDNAAKRIQDFADAYAAAQTYNQKLIAIDQEYNKKRLSLQDEYSGDVLAQMLDNLDIQKQASIDAAKDEAFQKTQLYEQLNEDIIKLSRRQVQQEIDAIRTVLSKGVDLPPELQQQLEKKLTDLQNKLNFSSKENYIKDLEAQKKRIDEALKSGKLSTEEFKKQEENLKKVNKQLEDAKHKGEEFAKTMQQTSDDILQISGAISNLSSSLAGTNDGLSATLETVSDIGNVLGNAAGAAADFASGNIVGGITKTINAIAGVFAIGAKARESERKAMEELQKYQQDLIKGEVTYNELLRDRARTQGDITKMTVQELQARQNMLKVQQQQAQADYNRLLQQIQATGNQVTGEHTEKYGGLLGIGRKTRVVQELSGLSETDYAELEKLFTEGKLDSQTAAWFGELQKVHDELDSIGESADNVRDQLNQTLTGTTSDAIADSIRDGLANGYKSAADFADNLQSLFTNAILSAFEANQIKPAMEQFYNQLAAFNTDGLLDVGEIDQLKTIYNNTVDSLAKQYDQIKQISGLADNNSSNVNSLQGAIKGMTEATAELLAGQFGGLRLTAVQQLQIATQQLNVLNNIMAFTADIPNMLALWRQINVNGLKIR
jgi:hypothetical protein